MQQAYVGVTGPRKLTPEQISEVGAKLNEILVKPKYRPLLLVGDANGVDGLARTYASGTTYMRVFHCNPHTGLPIYAQLAKRSEEMVRMLSQHGGTLHAWPNKPAPEGLAPSKRWPKNANGSGTWGTIAVAVGLGVPVIFHPLGDVPLPEWAIRRQMSLI